MQRGYLADRICRHRSSDTPPIRGPAGAESQAWGGRWERHHEPGGPLPGLPDTRPEQSRGQLHAMVADDDGRAGLCRRSTRCHVVPSIDRPCCGRVQRVLEPGEVSRWIALPGRLFHRIARDILVACCDTSCEDAPHMALRDGVAFCSEEGRAWGQTNGSMKCFDDSQTSFFGSPVSGWRGDGAWRA